MVAFNADVQLNFTFADTCRDVLGFDDQTFGPFAPIPSVQSAPNVAAFNRVVGYFIKSTFLGGGIPQNLTSQGIIAEVPITSAVGSLTNYAPFNPIKSNANELIGSARQSFVFTLVDQLGRDVSTGGEDWQFSIVIEYHVKT